MNHEGRPVVTFQCKTFMNVPGGRVSEIGPRAVGVVVVVAVVIQHLSTRENVTIRRTKVKFAFWKNKSKQKEMRKLN